MPWVRIDDSFDDHPKTLKLSPFAVTMHIRALCWCNRHLTDGVVPEQVLERLYFGLGQWRTPPDEKYLDIVAELVEAGLWEANPKQSSQGWIIHDYLKYNPSRKKVKKKLKLRALAGAEGGRKSGLSRRSKTQATRLPVASPKTNSQPDPDPIPLNSEKTHSESEIKAVTKTRKIHQAVERIRSAYPALRRNQRFLETQVLIVEILKLGEFGMARQEADILKGLKAWAWSEEWRRDGGRYVPKLYEFIRNRQWETPPTGGSQLDTWGKGKGDKP